MVLWKKTAVIWLVLFVSVLLLLPSCVFRQEPSGSSDKNDISHTVLPGDGDVIYESLHDAPRESVCLFPDVTHETVKELIANVDSPSSYCWYYTSTLYSSRKDMSRHGILIRNDGKYKIEQYDANNRLVRTVTLENGSLTVDADGSRSEFSPEQTSLFAEAGVPDANTFLTSSGEEFNYTLVESDYGTLLYAEFVSAKDGYEQTETYYISLDYGIVVRADCYENGTLIYSLETNALYELEDFPTKEPVF